MAERQTLVPEKKLRLQTLLLIAVQAYIPNDMSTIGIPIKLLHESQGHVITVELTNGQVYRGKLLEGNHLASKFPLLKQS